VPSGIEKNTEFVVDYSKLLNRKDVRCDDLGLWEGTGVKQIYIMKTKEL
jgi:hypothetical protein